MTPEEFPKVKSLIWLTLKRWKTSSSNTDLKAGKSTPKMEISMYLQTSLLKVNLLPIGK